jgi:hypothetical protein
MYTTTMSESIKELKGAGVVENANGDRLDCEYLVVGNPEGEISAIVLRPLPPEGYRNSGDFADLFLYMKDGRRLKIKVNAEGSVTADGPIQMGRDQDWWKDKYPWSLSTDRGHFVLMYETDIKHVTENAPSLNEARERFRLLDSQGGIKWAQVRPPSGFTEILKSKS